MTVHAISSSPIEWPAVLEHTLQQDFATLSDMVAIFARHRTTHPALVLDGQMLGYGSLHAQADQVAAALQRDGLVKGDVIAVCATVSLPYIITLVGAVRAGVVVAPLPPSLMPEQLAALIENAGARTLFFDASVARQMDAVLQTHQRSDCQVVLLDNAAGREFSARNWTEWREKQQAPEPVKVEPDDAFNIIYSSGTTGLPKGIVQPFSMRWAQLRRSPANGFGPDAVTLLAIPPYSNLTLTYLFGAIGLGGTVVIMPKFDAAQYLLLAQRHRATHSMLVPVQFQRLLDHPDFDAADLSSLQHKFCAGAPFSAALKQEVLQRWPGELTEYYGMTEGGGRTELAAHHFPHKLHTIGRPSAGNDIRLIDEDGRELSPTEAGELVGHSATMMSGYHGLPEQTREAEWFDAGGKRFIRTGDVARFDEDGFLVLLDRRKDMIISGGFNLYPSDLEAVLLQHSAVAEAAVVGVPSASWGETPVAYVVPNAGAEIDEAALREWANSRLGKTQRLADLQFIERLPRSEVGKVLKRQLRDAFDRQVP